MPLGTTMRFSTKFSDLASMPSGISMQYVWKLLLFATSAKRQHHAIGSDFCLAMTFVPVGNGMHFLSNVSHLGLSYFLTDKKLNCRRDCATPDAYFEGSVHNCSISKNPNFPGNEFLCFGSFTSWFYQHGLTIVYWFFYSVRIVFESSFELCIFKVANL